LLPLQNSYLTHIFCTFTSSYITLRTKKIRNLYTWCLYEFVHYRLNQFVPCTHRPFTNSYMVHYVTNKFVPIHIDTSPICTFHIVCPTKLYPSHDVRYTDPLWKVRGFLSKSNYMYTQCFNLYAWFSNEIRTLCYLFAFVSQNVIYAICIHLPSECGMFCLESLFTRTRPGA